MGQGAMAVTHHMSRPSGSSDQPQRDTGGGQGLLHFSDLADGLGVSSLPSPACALLLLSFLGVWTLLCMREEEREDLGRGTMGEES